MRLLSIISFIILSSNLVAQGSNFMPDTSLSGLILQDSTSLIKSIPDFADVIDYTGPGAKIYLISKDESEIATLIFHSGSRADIIAEIAVDSYDSVNFNRCKSIKSHIQSFITESGIRLGITKSELINIKGPNFTQTKKGQTENIRYGIADNTSNFLKRYQYPAYYANYEFLGQKLMHISFGFEAP